MKSKFIVFESNTIITGLEMYRYDSGGSRKLPVGGGYRTKELFTGLRIFSAGGHHFENSWLRHCVECKNIPL